MSDFHWDYHAFGEFLQGPEMLALVGERGEKAKGVAEATAPYRITDPAPHYKDLFDMTVGVRAGKHPRACATIFNTSDHAFAVEFGAGGTPRYRTLGRAIGVGG